MPTATADCVIHNIGQLATIAASAPDGLGLLTHTALAALRGQIVWIGADTEWRNSIHLAPQAIVIDAQGRLVTPGFVDSHTHIVYAGQRAAEFHERLSGVSYTAQLNQGRGILSTVAATR